MVEPEVAFAQLSVFQEADDIASFLSFKGIKGVVQEGDRCPLAVFMEIETGFGFSIEPTNTIGFLSDGEIYFDNTDAITHFITLFDEGWYPDLVEEAYYQ